MALKNRKSSRLTLRQRRKRRRIILTLVTLGLVFGGGYALSRLSYSKSFAVSEIKIQGNNLISEKALAEIIKKETASAYLGIFSKNNFLLLPRKKIEKEIAAIFKTVEAAELSFDGKQSVKLTVSERSPTAVWCPTLGSSNCFYMDSTGYIFAEAPKFSGNVYFKYTGLMKTDNPVDKNFLPPEEFKKLNDFIKDVEKLGLKSISLKISSETESSLELALGGSIIFSRKIEYAQTLQNLDTIITAEQAKSRGTFLKNLDYIDIRFSGKAFVKVKN